MDTKSRKTMGSVMLLLANILFWICNTYPRHILEWTSALSIVAILFNVCYFILYGYILVHIFRRDRIPLFDTRRAPLDSKKDTVKYIAILIILQLVVDALIVVLLNTLGVWGQIGIDIVLVLHWVIVYFVLTGGRKTNKPSNVLIISMLGIILLTAASIVFDVKTALDYLELEKKYVPFAPQLVQTVINAEFIHSIKALILESLVAIIFVSCHFFYRNTEKECEDNSSETMAKKGTPVGMQIIIMVVVVFIFCFLKMAIYPHSSIDSFNVSKHEVKKFEVDSAPGFTTQTLEVYRSNGYSDKARCYYVKSTAIFLDDATVKYSSLEGADAEEFVLNGNQLKMNAGYDEIYVDNGTVYVFDNRYLCYREDGAMLGFDLYDISRASENDFVISALEKMLSDGNLAVFEYATEYMLQYDEDFIEPYIERYAAGNFNESETMWLEQNFIKKEYISSVAKEFAE